MTLHYTIWDPTKNTTLLVDSPIPRPDQPSIAAELMARQPHVEQVGFLETPTLPSASIRLQMMGGEFCGNASMSAAAYVARSQGLLSGNIQLEVSGYDGLLECCLSQKDSQLFGTVSMPLPQKVSFLKLPGAGDVPAVFFSGIVHCIVPANQMNRAEAEAAIRPLCTALQADACGILLFDDSERSLLPLVYVSSTDTAVWESGCGSGSAALGTYLAMQAKKDIRVDLRQPGGVITVSAHWNEEIVSALSITGQVRFLEAGTCNISSYTVF